MPINKKLTESDIQFKLSSLKNWKYSKNSISKSFIFKNFIEALECMIKIGKIAEQLNHHPEWTNIYNKLDIKLNTHDANGVTDLDFELAKEIDALVENH